MDIGRRASYPASDLSNFAPHSFVFDGIKCASMEGLLQSFKYDDPVIQIELCGLTGFDAKRRGQERDAVWKKAQTLWWKGVVYDRNRRPYQELLDCAFNSLSQNELFKKALRDTGLLPLTHSIGKSDLSDTILTELEFCSRLESLRALL